MTRIIKSTAIALVLSVSAFAAHAGQVLNTIPLNYQGQPVSNKPVTTAAGLQRNTTIGSSLNVPHTVVTAAAGLQRNTTIGSSLNVPHTVVTTAAGLQMNTTLAPGAHSFTVAAPNNAAYSSQAAYSAAEFADTEVGTATRTGASGPVTATRSMTDGDNIAFDTPTGTATRTAPSGPVVATYSNLGGDSIAFDTPTGTATRTPGAGGSVVATYSNVSGDTFAFDTPTGTATRTPGAGGSVLATYSNINGTMISGGDNGW